MFPPSEVSGHSEGDPVSNKKLLEGEGEGDVRKEILGWVFDGRRRCIELPTTKFDAIILELKLILCQQSIPYKRFEKVVGRLRHAAIGLPAGQGLCTPFNKVISIHPKSVWFGKNSIVHSACGDWRSILQSTRHRPTHVNELVLQPISDVGEHGRLGHWAGCVWMSTIGDYPNTVHRKVGLNGLHLCNSS